MVNETNSASETMAPNDNSVNSSSCPRNINHYNPMVRLLHIPKTENGSCGFHLSRSKWDPYPWVSAVDSDTPAEVSGLKAGDCVLEVNGEDVVGLRITEVANLVKCKPDHANLLVWSIGVDAGCNPESICCGPMPLNLERLSACMQAILSSIECPVCMDTIPPPAIQCHNGHLLCAKCRIRSERCPVCRERYNHGRSLIAEQVYNSVMDAFCLRNAQGKLRDRLFGIKRKPSISRSLSDVNKQTRIQNPTNKFLAKIMGKAISLENLNLKKYTSNCLEVNGVDVTKSLSSNDITQQVAAGIISIPRCPSSSRLAGGEANVAEMLKGQIFAKRPTSSSLNASAEFHNGIGSGGGGGGDGQGPSGMESGEVYSTSSSSSSFPIPVPKRIEEKIFYCPTGEDCGKKFNAQSLQQHVTAFHNTPIVSFGASSAEIALPPRAPIEDASLVLHIDDKQVWLKLKVDSEGSIFTSGLIQGSEDESARYMIEAKIRNKVRDKLLERELITRSIVHSLTRTSWSDALERKLGVFYDADAIRTTFTTNGNETELLLRIDVKRRCDG